MAQSVERPTLAQVMISQSVSSSLTLSSVLTAQSLEPASGSMFLSLSAPPMLMLCLSLSLNNKCKKKPKLSNHRIQVTILKNFLKSIFFTCYSLKA